MRRRIVVVAHLWPGITPLNVMGLRLDDWLLFASAADDWVAARDRMREEG